jgi:predicted TIM-barrel fold metal-dependent hydrolase
MRCIKLILLKAPGAALFGALLLFGDMSRAGQPGPAAELYFVDAHSQVDSEEVLQRIILLMDQAGVRRTILSGRRHLASGDIATFAEQHAARITASIRTKGGAYEENKKGFSKALEKEAESGRFGAIAELLLYHAAKGKEAPEVAVYPNDERVQATLRLAKKHGWPLVLHIEFNSLSETEKSKYMQQLEALLAQNPDHPFAMIHMAQLDSDAVRRMIEAHKNVYFLTSHTNPVAIDKSNQPWTPMFRGDMLAPEWKKLVILYPDRFVLAFDNVLPDQWGDFYLQEAGYWRKAFAELPPTVAHAIAHGNAERLWKLQE